MRIIRGSALYLIRPTGNPFLRSGQLSKPTQATATNHNAQTEHNKARQATVRHSKPSPHAQYTTHTSPFPMGSPCGRPTPHPSPYSGPTDTDAPPPSSPHAHDTPLRRIGTHAATVALPIGHFAHAAPAAAAAAAAAAAPATQAAPKRAREGPQWSPHKGSTHTPLESPKIRPFWAHKSLDWGKYGGFRGGFCDCHMGRRQMPSTGANVCFRRAPQKSTSSPAGWEQGEECSLYLRNISSMGK